MDSQRTRGELIAEVGALRERVAALERQPQTRKRSNHLLRAFIDVLPVCGCSFDADGTVLEVLAGKDSALHPDASSLKGQKLHHFLPQEDAAGLLAAITETLETGREKSFEFAFSVLAGRRRFLGKTMAPKNGSIGSPTVICILEDITDRKKTTAQLNLANQAIKGHATQLRETDQRFRSLIDGSLQGIYIHENHKFLYVNQAFADLLGYGSPEEVLSIGEVFRMYASWEHDRLGGFYEETRSGGTPPVCFEFQGLRRDGSLIWLENLVQKIEWEGKAAILATVVDISERKNSDESLTRYLNAFENISEGVFFCDAEDRIISLNESMLSLNSKVRKGLVKGMAFEEMMRLIVAAGIVPEAVGQEAKWLQMRMERHRNPTGPFEVSRQNGIWVLVFEQIQPDGGILTIALDITERKQAEAAMQESEAKYRDLVETSQDLIWRKDEKGCFSYLNPAWEATLGYKQEEMLGRLFTDFKNPGEAARTIAVYKEVLAGGEVTDFETIYISKSGEELTLNFKGKPIYDNRGKIVGTQGTAHDITERKQAEAELRESEAKYRDLVETSQNLIWKEDREGRFTYLNPAWEKTLGYKLEEMLGRPFTEFEKPEEAARTLQTFNEYLGGKTVNYHQTTYLSRTGEERTLNFTVKPIFDVNGKTIGLQGTAQDITGRIRAEEELRTSKRLLQTVFDAIPHAIFVRDMEGRYIMVNQALAANAGLSQEDFIGKHFLEVEPHLEKERQFLLEADHLVMESGEPSVPSDFTVRSPGKPQQTFTGLRVPFTDGEGKVIGVVGVSEDVTEKKLLEEQLRQSQKMEAIGSLAGGIAHDFNNVLSPIMGYSALLMRMAAPDSKERDYSTTIFESAQRAKDLVSRILLFSRGGDAKKGNCDLRPVVREVIKLARSTLPATISMREQIPNAIAPVFCDPSQVHQVLVNLYVNAGDAMPNVGRLEFSVENVELDDLKSFAGKNLSGNYVRIAVSDTGTGMEEETMARIFDPFFTTKEVGKGTGLGLSTVFGIVQDHDGGIVVESQPGMGTTFEIFFPAVEEKTTQPLVPTLPVAGGGETILFIDDENTIAFLGKAILEDYGYTVECLTDSLQALELFEHDPGQFDLVVTDQSMPNMNGETLSKKLREIRPQVPIILCTGYSNTMNTESSKEIGINAFLYKPLEPAKLGRTVREVLDRQKTG